MTTTLEDLARALEPFAESCPADDRLPDAELLSIRNPFSGTVYNHVPIAAFREASRVLTAYRTAQAQEAATPAVGAVDEDAEYHIRALLAAARTSMGTNRPNEYLMGICGRAEEYLMRRTKLSAAASEAFVEMLANPPEPSEALVRGAKDYTSAPPSPEPPASGEIDYTANVRADLATSVARIPPDFPNYADWDVSLPAGHWRALVTHPQAQPPPPTQEAGWRPDREAVEKAMRDSVHAFCQANHHDGIAEAIEDPSVIDAIIGALSAPPADGAG